MIRRSLWFTFVIAYAAPAIAAPPPDRIVPASTVALTVAADLKELESHWTRCQYGRICLDSSMQPFFNGAGAELLGLFELPHAVGLNWAELKAMAGGPISSASMPLAPQQLGTVVMLDTTGHSQVCSAAIQNAVNKSRSSGTAIRQQRIGSANATVWEVPDGAGKKRTIGLLVKDDVLLIAEPPETLAPVLATWTDAAHSLGETPAYKSIRARAAMKGGEHTDVTWYLDPFGWDSANRAKAAPGRKRRNKDLMEVLRQEGFDGIKAVGGSAAFGNGGFDLLFRVAVYAPKPHRGALQMISIKPGQNLAPIPGLPGDMAACVVTRLDPTVSFESFSGIFDQVAADGEKGSFKEVLDDLRDNPKGPRVDFRKDIVGQLGEVATIFTDCQQPINRTSERAAVIFTVKDEKAISEAIHRAVKDDPKVRKRTEIPGKVVWEIIPEAPVVKPGQPAPPPPIGAAMCVADGRFYIATQFALLEKLMRGNGKEKLEAQPDFQRVSQACDRLGGQTACVRLFARPDEDFRLTYDLWRRGLLDEAFSLYTKGLTALIPKNPSANTVWRLDGKKLPDYGQVSKDLGPFGAMFFVHEDGWDAVGFALPKK